ncbi:MAG TPA: YbdK family carboxylate-amine ligase [Burkholderiales bacterium]|nr:YbdK family carboxylate-amine ligase [Burkholderiales bacterium]
MTLEFSQSPAFTMGVELELQLLKSHDCNLARDAADLLARLGKVKHPGQVKPEITESMIELNSSIHQRYTTLADELRTVRSVVARQAELLNLRIAGGGSHPFHQWSERRIYPTERFKHLLNLYGYLAKQFTVFGQHIHIGCPNGDDAVYLIHMLSRHIPHFIALSASSPFYQGEDTSFASSRLNAISAFPLSGTMPLVESWDEFNAYFEKMHRYKIVESMKDFYWDIRPKPEYGTVEIRVCDTPLTVDKAALLAAFAQALAHYYLIERPLEATPDLYLVYNYNRFQACRFGFAANFINPYDQQHANLGDDLIATLKKLAPHAVALESSAALNQLLDETATRRNDSSWLREQLKKSGSLNDVARLQSNLWMGKPDRA